MFIVYILKSRPTGKYYIGSTQDLENRLSVHNGSSARWTKKYQPWEIVHFEDFETRSQAMQREKFFKSLKGISKYLEEIRKGNL